MIFTALDSYQNIQAHTNTIYPLIKIDDRQIQNEWNAMSSVFDGFNVYKMNQINTRQKRRKKRIFILDMGNL